MMGTEFRTYDSKIHERVTALDLWAGAFRIRLVSALMFVILTILYYSANYLLLGELVDEVTGIAEIPGDHPVAGVGEAHMPESLARKYPNAPRE